MSRLRVRLSPAQGIRVLFARLAALLRRKRLDDRLDDEVRFHLELLTEQFIARGMNPQDARAAALRSFGGVTQMKEVYREQQRLPVFETVVQDLRYGVRTLLRTPGFTLAALVTLALGIGANTAIFSVVHAVLLRPLPYVEPERIVEVHRDTGGGLYNGHTFVRFDHLRDGFGSAEAVAAYVGTAFNAVIGDQAEYLPTLAVSHEYFRVFGGRPLHGRVFEPSEDVPNGPDVVILKHGLWQRMFGADPSAVGRTMQLGDRTFLIVGIMPPEFDHLRAQQVYVPLQPGSRGPGSGFNYQIAARLRPDVSQAQANAELATLFTSFGERYPKALMQNERAFRSVPYEDAVARSVRPALLVMLGAVGLLLLIACANTANLLLARATGRAREISVRAALGAARGRIIRQLLTESTLLFVVGGLAGVALAYWLVPTLLALAPQGYLPPQDVRVDWTVLAVTLGLSLLTGIIFGLAPAMSVSRPDLVEAFKEDGTRTTGSRRSNWVRRGLVAAEVALCVVLLVGAGLLIRTFVTLRSVELGFDPSNVLTARMSLAGERYASAAAVNELYARGLERLQRIPGVQSAAAVNGIPIERGLNLNFDRLDTPEREAHLTDWRYATPGYFDTMGIQIVRGRPFTASDTAGAPKVAVVSEQLARFFFKDADPIGRQIEVFREDGPIEIVGIARDVREAGLSGDVPAVMYVPVAQAGDAGVSTAHSYFQVSWVVRATGLGPALRERIREELRAIDPRQPITAFRSMDEVKARAMSSETFQMAILSTFAGFGLLLAAAGIYGLMAYAVAQRTREFGIRIALGASRRQVLMLVLGQAALLAAGGVATGVVVAVTLSRTLQSFLFGVEPSDPATCLAVSGILMFVALLASLVPAIRAVRLNPISALRE